MISLPFNVQLLEMLQKLAAVTHWCFQHLHLIAQFLCLSSLQRRNRANPTDIMFTRARIVATLKKYHIHFFMILSKNKKNKKIKKNFTFAFADLYNAWTWARSCASCTSIGVFSSRSGTGCAQAQNQSITSWWWLASSASESASSSKAWAFLRRQTSCCCTAVLSSSSAWTDISKSGSCRSCSRS